jgi:prepilin-type N-terminal cleavage/methylation domain-containing protein
MTRINQQRGFTLVEILVSVVLILICALIVSTMFIGQNRIFRTESAELNVTSDARSAIDDIDNYTRQATRTLSSYSTYTAGSQVLILQLRSVGASNQLLIGSYDTVVYYLDGSNLYRRIYPDASSSRAAVIKRLASSVNSLSFTYNSATFPQVTEVTTSITTQEDAGIQTRSITVSTITTLRNY